MRAAKPGSGFTALACPLGCRRRTRYRAPHRRLSCACGRGWRQAPRPVGSVQRFGAGCWPSGLNLALDAPAQARGPAWPLVPKQVVCVRVCARHYQQKAAAACRSYVARDEESTRHSLTIAQGSHVVFTCTHPTRVYPSTWWSRANAHFASKLSRRLARAAQLAQCPRQRARASTASHKQS